MAENEYSMLWATGTSADGADGYTAEEARQLWRAMYSNGVLKGYLNDLAVSTTGANNITVATGAAIIQGMPYFSIGDAVSKTVSTPAAGTTGLRIVLRVDWVGVAESAVTPPLYAATTQYTIRVLVISNADGTAAIPAATTTDGTCYDLTLATATIAQTTGIITITDARTYSAARGEIATAGIADSAVTAAKIANRTRSFMVPAISYYGYDWSGTAYEYLHQNNINGRLMEPSMSHAFYARGLCQVPQDYASGMTVTAIILNKTTQPALVGDIRHSMKVEYGAIGESAWVHTADVAEATLSIAATETLISACTASLTDASADDIVTMEWMRDGADVLDTYGNGFLYFVGFRVSYTADS